MKRLLVSNAAGTIAQSIARVVTGGRFGGKVEVIGMLGKEETAPNNIFHELVLRPESYGEPNGIDKAWLRQISIEKEIDLAIPTTDYESSAWAELQFPASTHVVMSSGTSTGTFHDKWATASACERSGVPFANSILPSRYKGEFEKAIAKPRFGGLSKGILHDFNTEFRLPDTYLIQEWLGLPEVTFAFYVTRQGRLLGPIVLERTLRYGMTFACLVRDDFYDEARALALKLHEAVPIVGPCNVQCRFDRSGRMTPFEVNCRFSGTCGIRADLGFSDIEFAIDEYLFGAVPSATRILSGGGIKRVGEIVDKNVLSWSQLRGV
jgi:carbamoyl-phosphate synthase large subunit